jgi:hypothetical protein
MICWRLIRSESDAFRGCPGLQLDRISHQLAPFRCTQWGWPEAGSKTYWSYWNWPSAPSLYDIFLDEERVIVILSFGFHFFRNRSGPSGSERETMLLYSHAVWYAQFPNNVTVRSIFTENDHQPLSKVLIFPHPEGTSFTKVKRIFTPGLPLSFNDVPFCKLPPPNRLVFGQICTQNLIADPRTILEWVAWHRVQGFDEMVIYMNTLHGIDAMLPKLAMAVENRSLRFVDWTWPKSRWLHDQVPAQMSCVWRGKGRVRWMGLNDVDEFLAPGPGTTVGQVLAQHEILNDTIGSLACCNRWFLGKGILESFLCASECTPPPHRQKHIVRPDNVDYYRVHILDSGLPQHRSDPWELYLAHFKHTAKPPSGSGNLRVVELSRTLCGYLNEFRTPLNKWLASFIGSN